MISVYSSRLIKTLEAPQPSGAFILVSILQDVWQFSKYKWYLLLTLNVPGDCGSSRPTRVEPRLHCVDIEWQVRGRCVGSAAHSPLHAIAARALSAARAIEPRPTHFARVRALGVPALITKPAHFARARALCVCPRGSAHYAWARAFCVGSRTLQPARLAAHALISFSMQFSTHAICYASKSRPILSNANTIFNPRAESESPP